MPRRPRTAATANRSEDVISPAITAKLLSELTPRDIAVLESLEKFRLLSSPQVRRLHFDQTHTTRLTATRSTNRVMARLEGGGMVVRLAQRVGGMGGGSSSLVWQLGPTGDSVLRARSGRAQRRRYVEPSGLFTQHTLAIVDVALTLIEAARRGECELLRLDTEPRCWRRFLNRSGVAEWLRPDLHVITAHDDFEDHSFIEVDLGTEHRPKLTAKAKAFAHFHATETYQDENGVFPLVVWIVPDQARRAVIESVLADDSLAPGLFHITTLDALPHGLQPAPVTGRAE